MKVLRAFRLIVLPKIYNGACQFQKHDQIRSTATPLRRDVSSLQLPPTLTPKRSQFYFNIWIFFLQARGCGMQAGLANSRSSGHFSRVLKSLCDTNS